MISNKQYEMRLSSQKSSAKYISRDAPEVKLPMIEIGDIVYVKSDLEKTKARDPYVV